MVSTVEDCVMEAKNEPLLGAGLASLEVTIIPSDIDFFCKGEI